MSPTDAAPGKRRQESGSGKSVSIGTDSGGQALRVTPADHVRMLADLLQPATPDLARRWLAALLMVPAAERAAIVSAVEAKIVEEFGRVDASRLEVDEQELNETSQRIAAEQTELDRRKSEKVRDKNAGARGSRMGTDARSGSGSAKSALGGVDAAESHADGIGATAKRSKKSVKSNSHDEAGLIEVVHPPVQKAGYIEQVITTYEKMDGPRIGAKESERKKKKGA